MLRLLIILAFLAISASPVCPAQEHATDRSTIDPSPAKDTSGFWKEISNYRGWQINSLSITGLDGVFTNELKKGLELEEKDAVLYERNLRRDIDRIRLFLALRAVSYTHLTLPTILRV